MKARRLTLILLMLFAFALATACAGEPAQESPATVIPKTTEGPDIVVTTKTTKAPDIVVTTETTEGPVETQDPEIKEEPELVWSHKHENNIKSVATSGETLAVGEYKVSPVLELCK